MSKKSKNKEAAVEETPAEQKEAAPAAEQEQPTMSPEVQVLFDAAKDINESLGFNLDMKKYQDEESLVSFLKKAHKQIVPQDVLKDTTRAALEKLGLSLKPADAKEEVPPQKEKAAKKEKAPKAEGESTASPKTPFGHRVASKAGQIDLLLLEGGKVADIGKKVGATDTYIRGHTSYLKSKKGAQISSKDDVYTAKVG